jgi:tetratricopeptide (TPR) repeat protein
MLGALADACFSEGAALLAEGSPGTALTLLWLAAILAVPNAQRLFFTAKAASELGKRDQAASYCERALALDPSFVPAHELLMNLYLPGENYLVVLDRIHQLLKPRTYIEIGVSTGDSIRLAGRETICIGVDPQPEIEFGLPPNVRVFRQTSDEFFMADNVSALLGGAPLDVAFIDGLHLFEFALRDFINLERLCHPDAVILIHDCFPHDRLTAQRERVSTFWTGDVWRLIPLLKKYRPDLVIHTIATPPTGLGVVRRLDPTSTVLTSRLAELEEEFLGLDYSYLEKQRARKLNLFPNDWNSISSLLGPASAR